MKPLASIPLGAVALSLVTALFASCAAEDASSPPATPDAAVTADGDSLDGTTTTDGATSSDGAAAGDPFVETSGARIKLETQTSADGFRHRVGLYDSELAVTCVVGKTADGARRCMPANAAGAFFFSDAACTIRVALYESCRPKPAYASSSESTDACTPSTYRMYSVGAQVAPTELFEKTGDGSCVTAGAPNPSTSYATTTELAPTTFAVVDENVVSVSPELTAVFDETSDGLHALRVLRDAKHGGVDGEITIASDGALRLLPSYGSATGAIAIFYSDPSCTARLAQWTCPNFSLARSFGSACPGGASIFHVGAARDADAGTFRKTNNACTAANGITTLTFKPVQGEIPATEFIAATPTLIGTTSRLRVQGHLLQGHTIALASSSIFDTQKDTACSMQRASDGKTRCVPQSPAYVEAFADDQCKTPLAILAKTSCTLPKYAYRFVSEGCDGYVTAHPLLAKRASATGYHDYGDGAGCVAEDYGASGNDLYDIGPEIPATELVEISQKPE